MANIIGLQQQQDALAEISKILKELKVTNGFLQADNPSTEYAISFKDAEGKKLGTPLTASKEEINALVNRYKEERKAYVLKLAQDYRIALDPEDNEILGITE